jgi:quercetin dioxygenase-like cupin family protein
MIVRVTDKVVQAVQQGMMRSVLSYGEQVMLVEVSLQRGTQVPTHAHPHEQVTYVIRGSVEFTVADRTEVLAAGESYLFPPGTPHGAEALTDCMLIDAFSPPREDFI